MRKLVFMLAFVLVGTFAFANTEINHKNMIDLNSLNHYSESNFNNFYISSNLYFGTCYFHMEIYNSEGEIIQTYNLTWESLSEGHCKSESDTLARFLISPYL